MASSSSSSTSYAEKGFKYDVFLSFRGEDTRKNFVGHLYEALEAKCIETYKDDDKIEKGERISDQLLKSIEESRYFIIVFSKTYASSSWCLDELVKIMECHKTREQTAYPVFFDVEPTQVRKQTGPVGEAFSNHENHEAAGKWRDAMKELADLAGWELKATANGDESKIIRIIVDAIFKTLHSTNSSADGKLVGMETRISNVLSSLEIGTQDVRMIGIKGIGGGGKTTLARAVYDRISTMFEGKSFVENVREVSKPSFSGLKKLQKKILKDVLNKQDITFSSVHDGREMLIATMCRRRILVVLDDVDCIEQLEALVGESNWFKLGSRIIITTRDEQVLSAHRVNFIHDVNLLSCTEAICLFSRYAFQRDIPTRGYEELSGQVVQYAHGLPLTIKVLGSFLCDQKEPVWIDAIKRLKTMPLKATMERLELSYNGLEGDYKEIFLDVACLLKGWWKKDAINVLKSRGFHAENGLRVLEQKSLIFISESYEGEELGMHDHLEEMGKNIVRRLYPDKPYKCSRLWIHEEIEDILTNGLGTRATKCLCFSLPGGNVEIAMKGLANMKDLRFIDLETSARCDDNSINRKFDKVSQYLPNSLQFVKWIGFPFSSLPNTFQGENLVGLELHNSNIVQLWEDGEEKVLHKLRFLVIWNSRLRTIDLRSATNLERLEIHRCYDLADVHMPAKSTNLRYLQLDHNSQLKTLHIGSTLSLETATLTGCSDMVEFQMPAESLKLIFLNLTHLKLKTVHLGNTPNLKKLILERCDDLAELQMPDESLNLEYLRVSHSKLKTVHLGNTPNLEKLILEGCDDLVQLQMPNESLNLEYLCLRHSKLKTIHLGNSPNLKELIVNGCNDLVELQMPAESLKLAFLDIRDSKQLIKLHLGNSPNLKELIVDGPNDLVEPQMPARRLKLARLNIRHSKQLISLHLGNCLNLEKLILEGCDDLVQFQMPNESLNLEYFCLKHSKLKTIHLRNSPNLKKLIVDGCNDLVELQMPAESLKLARLHIRHSKLINLHLGNSPKLKELIVDGCNDLVEIQIPAKSLKLAVLNLVNTQNLKSLVLEGCNNLVELQMPNECLNLEHLNFSHSNFTNLHLVNSPNLKALILECCNDLVELQMPDECLNLEYLNLSHSKLINLHLVNSPNLKVLILEGCNDLVELQMPDECLNLEYLNLSHSKLRNLHLGNTPNLKILLLEACNEFVELQMSNQSLNLEYLNLSHSKLKTVHLGNTPNLEKLILEGCYDFVELQIPSESPKLVGIYLSHSKLRTLDLRLTPNLKWLNLENCYDLVEINAPSGFLKNIVLLVLSGCGRFKSFQFDRLLDSCEVGSLSELHLIAETIDVCLLHPDNTFPKFRFECYYKEDPASSFGTLEMLMSMGLCACTNLENFSRIICSLRGLRKLTLEGSIPEVPRDLDRLECLEELIFSSTDVRYLPDSICMLKNLKSLELKSCLLLKKLPDDLGRMESLETLTITDCNRLRDVPNNIEKIKCVVSPKVYKRYTHGKFKQQP